MGEDRKEFVDPAVPVAWRHMPTESSELDADRQVTPGLRALLEGIVDYAGLFPPARLDMAETTANYAQYLAGESAWMLGRVVIPVKRLDEFEKHAARFLPVSDEPWHISGLTAPADDPRFEEDLKRIARFNERHAGPDAGLARIGVIEVCANDTAGIDRVLELLPEDLFPFFELPLDMDPRGLVASIAGSDGGAKVRTGGLEPGAVPPPRELARFIEACASAGVPFKATAGLHHPLHHFSDAAAAEEYGFLNLFVAAAIAAGKDHAESDLVGVLTERSIGAFAFGANGVCYRRWELTVREIQQTRLSLAVAFGACSFEEPLEGLQALGLLKGTKEVTK